MDLKRIYLSAGIAGLIVLLLYAWFMSLGLWRTRGYTSDYYWQIASAFQHGQLELEAKPDPALLALPNLYDPKARKNIPLLGDASVYDGKYYLYFGPLPSLVLAPILSLVPIKPGDQVFAYIFIIGLFMIQSLFFLAIFRRYFSHLPTWIIPLGILFLGVMGPFTRMLVHPYIHEASISGGQFFSTAGLYAAFVAFHDKPINPRKLSLSGLLWAFSIATKITQLLPIAFMILISSLFILYEYRKAKSGWQFLRPIIALLTPLLVTGILLAWYNWARFNSIFEFGLYYQLAAFNLQANYDALFSRVHVIQNIYNYFFNPFEFKGTFPFAYPLAGSEKAIWLSHELPKLYAVEGKFPGLLTSSPILVFAVVPFLTLLRSVVRMANENNQETQSVLWNWIAASLIASFVAGSIPTLLIFYVGFRYETEFVTALAMLALVGFCQSYFLFKNRLAQKGLTILGASLMIFSLLVNIALAYTGIYSFSS